jgi:hypothetical protein
MGKFDGTASQLLDQAERIVCDSLYQISGMSVFLSNGKISRLDRYDLLSMLNRTDSWKAGNRVIRTGFPAILATLLLRRLPASLPPLRGVWRCPFFLSDSRIVSSYGYDRDSHIFLDFRGDFIPLQHPSKDLAIRSLDRILKRLEIFSFQNEESRSAALAVLISCFVRPMLSQAPLFSFVSSENEAINFINWVSRISVGKQLIAVSPLQSKKEEMGRLLTMLFEGNPLIVFDRMNRFGQSALNDLISQEEYKWFLKKEQKTIDIPILSLFFSVNSPLMHPLSKKTIFCFLKSQKKQEEWREGQRMEVFNDCLILLKTYYAEGISLRRELLLSGFENWDVWVRGLLLWMNLADPLIKTTPYDPFSQDLGELMQLWFVAFEGRPVRIKHLLTKSLLPGQELLRAILVRIAPSLDGDINARVLGKKLSLYEKRSIGGFLIQKCGLNQGAETWKVFKV